MTSRGESAGWVERRYATTQILQTDLNDLRGQEVLLFPSTWQPGYRLPWHMHPEGHEFTFVIEGEQTFETEGGGTKIVKAGEAAVHAAKHSPLRAERYRQGL